MYILKNKRHGGFMPYHQTQSIQLKACISDSLKNQILVSIGNAVINFRDTLVSLGYYLAQKAHNNQEAAKKLCGAAEVVYDGFKGDNENMKKYQDDTLSYTDTSLMITIFNNLIRGVNVLEDEANPNNLNSVAILGEIGNTYCGHDIHSYLCHD